jgi:hypothetical protein
VGVLNTVIASGARLTAFAAAIYTQHIRIQHRALLVLVGNAIITSRGALITIGPSTICTKLSLVPYFVKTGFCYLVCFVAARAKSY